MWSICGVYFLLLVISFSNGTNGVWSGFRTSTTTQLAPITSKYSTNDDLTKTCIDYTSNGLLLSKGGISVLLQTSSSGNVTYRLMPSYSSGQLKPSRGSITFHGLVGIYNMPMGMHLLIIRESESLEFVTPFRLFKATAYQFIKIPVAFQSAQDRLKLLLSSPVLAFRQRQKQAIVEELLLTTMRKHHFYFSDSLSSTPYDISSSFQDNFFYSAKKYISKDSNAKNQLRDDRFFWNAASTAELRAVAGDMLVAKLCSGFLSSFSLHMHDTQIQYFLFSRRSKTRQGPRYIKRGVDANAEVANFVETEQIVAATDTKSPNKRKLSSFRQIRGSVPLHWNQHETWKLRPPIVLDADEQADLIDMKHHIENVYIQYCSNNNISRGCDNSETSPSQVIRQKQPPSKKEPNIYLINLIDKKGSQGELGSRWFNILSKVFSNKEPVTPSLTNRSIVTITDFASSYNDISNIFHSIFVRFLWLDYHYQVKKFGVEALRIIHKFILPALTSSRGGFFLASIMNINDGRLNPSPLNSIAFQRKLIRTNCVDCLDRTNVVQTVIGRWALIQQLSAVMDRVSVASSNSLTLPSTELETNFRVAWADTGDHLSTLYAGSRAMKRDVTRTGKRTRRGMVDDALSFAQRYVANNYRDSTFQKAIDFLLGLHKNAEVLLDKELLCLGEDEEEYNNDE